MATNKDSGGREVWKDVQGHEERYQVSDQGRVRSLPRKRYCGYGKYTEVPGKVLNLNKHNMGYRWVTLGKVDRTRKAVLVHRLVLETFVGPCPKGMNCCHGDGDPANNRLGNLRWDTQSENMKDAVRHGTQWSPGLKGEENGNSRLTEKQVEEIRSMYASGEYTQKGLGNQFGVSQTMIFYIVSRKQWKRG